MVYLPKAWGVYLYVCIITFFPALFFGDHVYAAAVQLHQIVSLTR